MHLPPNAQVGIELHALIREARRLVWRSRVDDSAADAVDRALAPAKERDEVVDQLGIAQEDLHCRRLRGGVAAAPHVHCRPDGASRNPPKGQTPGVRAMVLDAPRTPLRPADIPEPQPGVGDLLVRVTACAVCRTDLHIVDGELSRPKLPLVIGHQIVGEVVGEDRRVGIPWLGWTDGECRYCRAGLENLCDRARFTGYDRDGGYAEYAVADERYCFAIPESYSDLDAAPLLCAGLIGYRALSLAGDPEVLGLYGFGASAHIIAQVARHEGRRVFAFTRDGDAEGQEFARSLGAEWAGGSSEHPPEELDAAIIFAPVGELVPVALRAVRKGGVVVCAGIHMSDIPSFPYDLLWGERVIHSVANLTRRDGEELLALAPKVPIRTEIEVFRLEQANDALDRLRGGRIRGSAVLDVTGKRDP
jgi:propanol-preferring alcohol dehydrogenase